MEEKQRNILERNRWLLVGNIISSDEFFHILKSENVLPDTMIRDIQEKKSQFERNSKLLETLRLRGGDAYRKFRHVLYLSGHQLLADHLYGEDIDTKLLRAEDVFGKFPKVFNHISDDTKTKLLKYLETKVKERAVTNAWLTAGQERSEVLEARKINYDSEKDYRIKLESKTKKITQMRDEMSRLKEEIKQKDDEIDQVQREIAEMQRRFKQDLGKQTRFNAANNHSIIQLRERFDNFNERVRVVNVAIRQFLDTEQKDIEDDSDNLKISVLERNVRKLIHLARTNIETTTSSNSEKEAVLNLLRTSSRHKQYTLSEIVQQYVEKQERAKTALATELENVLVAVRGPRSKIMNNKSRSDLKFLKSQMAMLREEVEHMRKKIEWKDAQISDLIKEKSAHVEANTSSTRAVMFPRLSMSSAQRDSPDSTKEIEKVYQQFDRLNTEVKSPPQINRHRTRRGSLAEVDLEGDSPPHPGNKRRTSSSRLEPSDLDLFSPSVNYRRSLTDIGSSSVQSPNKMQNGSIDKTPSPRHTTMNEKLKFDLKRRRENRPEPEMDYIREGRRPSLAELITIYESHTDDTTKREVDE